MLQRSGGEKRLLTWHPNMEGGCPHKAISSIFVVSPATFPTREVAPSHTHLPTHTSPRLIYPIINHSRGSYHESVVLRILQNTQRAVKQSASFPLIPLSKHTGLWVALPCIRGWQGQSAGLRNSKFYSLFHSGLAKTNRQDSTFG